MQLARPTTVAHSRRFGRGPMRHGTGVAAARAYSIAADLKLFTVTFVAGFVFVSILIG